MFNIITASYNANIYSQPRQLRQRYEGEDNDTETCSLLYTVMRNLTSSFKATIPGGGVVPSVYISLENRKRRN